MEYGYSCMGYEIAGGLGIKMANPEREVYVLVGDGSYLMMAQEIVTSLQEGHKLNIVLLDNHGFSSIGGLSRGCGNEGMGTNYRYRRGEKYDGELLPVDFAANAASLGAHAIRARTHDELVAALDGGAKITSDKCYGCRDSLRRARSRVRILVGRSDRRSFRARASASRRAK